MDFEILTKLLPIGSLLQIGDRLVTVTAISRSDIQGFVALISGEVNDSNVEVAVTTSGRLYFQ